MGSWIGAIVVAILVLEWTCVSEGTSVCPICLIRTAGQQCSGVQNFTSLNGSFGDGSGPGTVYQNNLRCSWVIRPDPPVNMITVSFTTLATETAYDFVRVTQGDGRSLGIYIIGIICLTVRGRCI